MVSVVIATYNYARYIGDTIRSVQAQTYPHWELIVIDDGSTDDTAAVVKSLADADERIRYVYQQNAKKCKARNHGASLAKYPLLAFCDGDDQWLPHKLALQMQLLEEKSVDLVFTAYQTIDEQGMPGKPIIKQPKTFAGETGIRAIFDSNPILFSSVLLKKDYFDQVGGFEDIQSPSAEDYHLWLRLIVAGASFYRTNNVAVLYRRHSSQSSASDYSVTPFAIKVFRHLKAPTAEMNALKRLYMKKWYRKLLAVKRMEDKAAWKNVLEEYKSDTGDAGTSAIAGVLGKISGIKLAQSLMQKWLTLQTRGIEKYNQKLRAEMNAESE